MGLPLDTVSSRVRLSPETYTYSYLYYIRVFMALQLFKRVERISSEKVIMASVIWVHAREFLLFSFSSCYIQITT